MRGMIDFVSCSDNAERLGWFGNENIFFGSYGSGSVAAGASRDGMISKCQENATWCTRLLQNDQWEFKSDYPYKF